MVGLEQSSLIAHTYNFPSLVGCSAREERSDGVGEPGPIQARGLELALDQVVVYHRAGDLGAAAALDDHRDDLVFPAQPGDPITAHRQAVGQGQLVVDEPVSEGWVIDMDIDGGVGQVSIIPVPLSLSRFLCKWVSAHG